MTISNQVLNPQSKTGTHIILKRQNDYHHFVRNGRNRRNKERVI
jgi:hypothetical protein